MGLFGFPRLPGIPHTLPVTNYSTAHTWFHRSKQMTTWPEAHKILCSHLIHAPKKIKSLKQNVNGTKSSHQIFMPHIQLLHHPIAFKVTCVALLPVIQIGQKLWIHYILLYHSLMNFELHVFMTATNKTTHTFEFFNQRPCHELLENPALTTSVRNLSSNSSRAQEGSSMN